VLLQDTGAAAPAALQLAPAPGAAAPAADASRQVA
jgi:hypothetical protein